MLPGFPFSIRKLEGIKELSFKLGGYTFVRSGACTCRGHSKLYDSGFTDSDSSKCLKKLWTIACIVMKRIFHQTELKIYESSVRIRAEKIKQSFALLSCNVL